MHNTIKAVKANEIKVAGEAEYDFKYHDGCEKSLQVLGRSEFIKKYQSDMNFMISNSDLFDRPFEK